MRRKVTARRKKKTARRASPHKLLSETLYLYVRPANDRWVRKQAKKKGVAYSVYVDRILSHARNHA